MKWLVQMLHNLLGYDDDGDGKNFLCISFADVESVMNSIVSLLLILETEKQESLIESLCEKLVKFREGERPSLRMQL